MAKLHFRINDCRKGNKFNTYSNVTKCSVFFAIFEICKLPHNINIYLKEL